jgi:hypothetical protein
MHRETSSVRGATRRHCRRDDAGRRGAEGRDATGKIEDCADTLYWGQPVASPCGLTRLGPSRGGAIPHLVLRPALCLPWTGQRNGGPWQRDFIARDLRVGAALHCDVTGCQRLHEDRRPMRRILHAIIQFLPRPRSSDSQYREPALRRRRCRGQPPPMILRRGARVGPSRRRRRCAGPQRGRPAASGAIAHGATGCPATAANLQSTPSGTTQNHRQWDRPQDTHRNNDVPFDATTRHA